MSTFKKPKTTTFSRVFHPKNRQFSREIKVEYLDKKDFEQCDLIRRLRKQKSLIIGQRVPEISARTNTINYFSKINQRKKKIFFPFWTYGNFQCSKDTNGLFIRLLNLNLRTTYITCRFYFILSSLGFRLKTRIAMTCSIFILVKNHWISKRLDWFYVDSHKNPSVKAKSRTSWFVYLIFIIGWLE